MIHLLLNAILKLQVLYFVLLATRDLAITFRLLPVHKEAQSVCWFTSPTTNKYFANKLFQDDGILEDSTRG